MTIQYRLTTIDNPFDPFKEFDKWYKFDSVDNDYNSCGLLARIAEVSDELSEDEQIRATNEAIDFILENDLTGKRIKVSKQT